MCKFLEKREESSRLFLKLIELGFLGSTALLTEVFGIHNKTAKVCKTNMRFHILNGNTL
jgi:hypothetical protein